MSGSNIIIPVHMQSAPNIITSNRKWRRNTGNRDMHKMTQEGPALMTDEVRVKYLMHKEFWATIDERRKPKVLEDLGFDMSYTIHATPIIEHNGKWYMTTKEKCTHIEFIQGWD